MTRQARKVSDMGDVEKAVYDDLRQMPEFRRHPLAVTALLLARHLDEGDARGMTIRDEATLAAQFRACIVQLREWKPGEKPGDSTVTAKGKIEDARKLYAVGEDTG
jgi:hypothetical protein